MNDKKTQMNSLKELLNDIDDFLAQEEDYIHGEAGEQISELRSRISKHLKSIKNDKEKDIRN